MLYTEFILLMSIFRLIIVFILNYTKHHKYTYMIYYFITIYEVKFKILVSIFDTLVSMINLYGKAHEVYIIIYI